eukprot:GEMP01102126.1.p1 GENE.GEMP01102126.1~~GEMP01102126.1.p1  ORF type:complete len:153 (-),score=34.41 GEMP01102126.1:244-702(-)
MSSIDMPEANFERGTLGESFEMPHAAAVVETSESEDEPMDGIIDPCKAVIKLRALLLDSGRFHSMCASVFAPLQVDDALPSAEALRSALNTIMRVVRIEDVTPKEAEDLFMEHTDVFEFYTLAKTFCETLCRSIDGSYVAQDVAECNDDEHV